MLQEVSEWSEHLIEIEDMARQVCLALLTRALRNRIHLLLNIAMFNFNC